MGIKRYTAIADTTITNAYKSNLTGRATASNMGLSDSLEVFRVYGQQSSGSSELSRILVKFQVTGSDSIKEDRDNEIIPESGSVSFYLRMFNAKHPFTLPRNYYLTVGAVSRSWDEGTGMDMEAYADEGAANWVTASSGSTESKSWTNTGGDFHSSPTYSAYFDDGTEDIVINISELVEQWVSGSYNPSAGLGKANDGIGIYLSNETAFSSSYTKKFFARGSEFFFKRPIIEARWDSAKKDDRGNFYYSSSLADGPDNLNTLYLYNHVRGRLKNIPGIGKDPILVSLYGGNSNNSAPSGSKLKLSVGGGVVTALDPHATGGWVATGIYSCSLAITAATRVMPSPLSNPLSHLFDVWHNGAVGGEYFTGSAIKPKLLAATPYNPYSKYALNITNLRDVYYRGETAQFRVFTRQKDWNPNIYTKASIVPEVSIIDSGSFKVIRLIDNSNVVQFGTGSDLHTQLSFDASGSYFSLDMSMLQSGYAYGIKFAFYDDTVSAWNEYPDMFKFRVEE